MALKLVRGHNAFRCGQCKSFRRFSETEEALMDEATNKFYDVACDPQLKAKAPEPPQKAPPEPPAPPKPPKVLPALPPAPQPTEGDPAGPRSYVVNTGPMKMEKSIKIGLPAFSSAYASVQDWARDGETAQQLADRLTERLERDIDEQVRMAFRVHERIARGEVGKA